METVFDYGPWDVERKVVIKSRDVIFNHSSFPYSSSLSQSSLPQRKLVKLPWPNPVPAPTLSMESVKTIPILQPTLQNNAK
jgi:hypothetical protein